MQKQVRKIAAAVLAVLLLTIVGQAALAAGYSAKVLTSSMKVYLGPDTGAVPAGSLKQGTSFRVDAIKGEWAKISYRGRSGYAQLRNIMFNKGVKGHTIRDTSLLFITRDSYSKRVSYRAKLAAGTPVYVRGICQDRLLVSNAQGTILGFVSRSDCTKG